jgi:hypothetical protein
MQSGSEDPVTFCESCLSKDFSQLAYKMQIKNLPNCVPGLVKKANKNNKNPIWIKNERGKNTNR